MGKNGHLSTAEAAELLGVSRTYLGKWVRRGRLPACSGGGSGSPYQFLREDVIEFWREQMGGACLRCGILGEAAPERGFLCVACEYEERTGKIYRWPTYPQVIFRPALRGVLVEGFGKGG